LSNSHFTESYIRVSDTFYLHFKRIMFQINSIYLFIYLQIIYVISQNAFFYPYVNLIIKFRNSLQHIITYTDIKK
jgi:hypothetical protein